MSKWGMPPTDMKRKGQGDMGPPAKKKKFSPAFKHQPGNSPAYNPRYEGAQSSFRGGYRSQGAYRGNKKNRNKGARGSSGNRGQGNQGNTKRDFSGNRGGHQPGNSGHKGGRGGGRGGQQSSGGHPYSRSEAAPSKKSQSQPPASN